LESCPKCSSIDAIIRAGMIRGKVRFYCKSCSHHFSESSPAQKIPQKHVHITIKDIANIMGVSIATVSRALNNKGDINPNTRAAIQQLAKELDYNPNLIAKGLNQGETKTLGVVIPNIKRPFFAGVLSGIQEVASSLGYRVIICQSNESFATEFTNIQGLIASHVDGLLISHSKETTSFEQIKNLFDRGLPMVHFDRICTEVDTPKIRQQDFEGSFQLVEHLIEQGYQRIALLAGPKELLISQKRKEGYLAALKKHGLKIQEDYIRHGDFSKEFAIQSLEHWMNLSEAPDAIFAVHYLNAVEIILKAKEMAIGIPNELGIVGFGDEFVAEAIQPSLTVFHLFPQKVGEVAAKLLLEIIANKEAVETKEKMIDGQLIIRQSSLKKGNYLIVDSED
jgi:DNA-binding LacI/PurR family transcriptional regulator